MIVNKNSNHSLLLKTRLHYERWVIWFEVQQYKTLFTVRLNIHVINDVRTAMKTFRAERRYSIRYRILDRGTNWKPNNTGRLRCNSSNYAVTGVYGLASFWITLSLRFQSCTYRCITREQWRKFIFTVNSCRFNS